MRSVLLKLRTHRSPLWIIFEVNFFKQLSVALMAVVLPLYFKTFVHTDTGVGVIYFFGYLTAFVGSFFSARIIAQLHKRRVLIIVLIGFTTLFSLFTILNHTALVLGAFSMYQFLLALFVVDVGLYVKHYSNYRNLATNEGTLGSLGNIGWLIGPLLGSLIADRFDYNAVFLCAAVTSSIALISFFFVHLKHEDSAVVIHTESSFKNAVRFFKDPNLRRMYLNNAGLNFIYSIWDYLPLLMTQIGASLPVIGMTRTLMGVPQTTLEYPLGRIADQEKGERKLFVIGYFLAALFTALLGVYTDIRLFIISFFLAAVGTAFLEMTRDAYFFRRVKESDVQTIGVYRTSDTLPFIVGQLFAIAITSFFPLSWLFVLGGAALLGCVLNAYQLRK